MPEPVTEGADEALQTEDLDVENVTDSWVDRHSLLPKEVQATLTQEREKLEKLQSPKGNPLDSVSSRRAPRRGQPKYARSINPLKWVSKIFKTGSEKQRLLGRKGAKAAKEGAASARHYPVKNEIRYNSYSYRFEKKSIFSMPNLGLFAEKFHLKAKGDGARRPSFLKKPRPGNFAKKTREFKDEISGKEEKQRLKEEKQRLKEELVRGKRREKIKAVQSMSTSVVQNITDSKILIVKTRSGKEIKNKTCLSEVKQILADFRKDLESKQSRMRENHEDILELRCSVRRLESDLKQAQAKPGTSLDTRAKERKIKRIREQILGLESTNKTLSGEMSGLTAQIERLKQENEDNLKEVSRVVKRKFREIEQRNRAERQVQKDIILKYNVELESKNTEINELIRRYHELRLLNEDLGRELARVRKRNKRSKSATPRQPRAKTKSLTQRQKSRSRLADDQMMRRASISQNAILKSIADFEEALRGLDAEVDAEEKRLEGLARAKEKSKRQLYELELEQKRKAPGREDSGGLEARKASKTKSLEAKHRSLKARREALVRLAEAAGSVRSNGKKVVHATTEQLRSILLTKEELKKRDRAAEEQAKREKYLARVNEIKEEKLCAKNAALEKLKARVGNLERQVRESRRVQGVREKSNVSSKDFRLKKGKTLSTNNLELPPRKKRLYHNTNKAGSQTHFFKGVNKQFMSETLDGAQGGRLKAAVTGERKGRKSSTISRAKLKGKRAREDLGKKYETMIKSTYKNVLGNSGKKRPSKASRVQLRRNNATRTAAGLRKKLAETEKELRVLGEKYAALEKKYMETHNDLLRSNNSVKVEALRIKKQSERSLQRSLRAVVKPAPEDKVETRDKCVGISLTIPMELGRARLLLRWANQVA